MFGNLINIDIAAGFQDLSPRQKHRIFHDVAYDLSKVPPDQAIENGGLKFYAAAIYFYNRAIESLLALEKGDTFRRSVLPEELQHKYEYQRNAGRGVGYEKHQVPCTTNAQGSFHLHCFDVFQ